MWFTSEAYECYCMDDDLTNMKKKDHLVLTPQLHLAISGIIGFCSYAKKIRQA